MGRKKHERLTQIKGIIAERGSATAQELADLFGTSRRTVYRYMDKLKDEGLNIEACPGSHGGFRLAALGPLKLDKLTMEECRALMMAASTVEEHGLLPFAEHLSMAVEKIRRSLSAEDWAEIRETMPNVSVLVEKLADYEEKSQLLEQLTESIAAKTALALRYYVFHRDKEEEREIDPYHLFYQGGAWYVVGYCHARKDVRTFRVDRIRWLESLKQSFERPRNFSLAGYLGSAWGMVRGERHQVSIRFLPPVSRLIAESQWHPTQRIEPESDVSFCGSVIFRAEVDGLDEIRRWVLSFAEYAEVIEPKELRDSIRASLLKTIHLYGEV